MIQIMVWQLILAVIFPDALYVEDVSMDDTMDTLVGFLSSLGLKAKIS